MCFSQFSQMTKQRNRIKISKHHFREGTINIMLYKNISNFTKKFYGVNFKPGETKDVPGYINDPDFERIHKKPEQPTPKTTAPVKEQSAANTTVKPKEINKDTVEKKQEVKDGSDNSK